MSTIKPIKLPEGSRLTILKSERIMQGGKVRTWLLCRCECGIEGWKIGFNVLNGNTKSCGCKASRRDNKGHRLTRTKAWRAWESMKRRCTAKNSKDYERYGGRGISVCDEWLEFSGFYKYLLTILPDGETQIPRGLSLDRIDNNRGYEPGNVRLATPSQQSRNRCTSKMLSFDGKTLCMKEWAEITGMRYATIVGRKKLGWSDEEILTTPLKKNNVSPLA